MKKFKKIIKRILIILSIFIAICLLPDLLFVFRGFINKITGGCFDNLSDVEYTKIVVPTLFSGVAVSVSVIAAIIAKENKDTQNAKHVSEIMYSSSTLLDNIYHNTHIIFSFKKSYVGIDGLNDFDKDSLMKKIYLLYAVDKVSFTQVELFEEYIDKLKNIISLRGITTDGVLQSAVTAFCDSYIKNEVPNFKGEFKKLVDKLEEIKKKED